MWNIFINIMQSLRQRTEHEKDGDRNRSESNSNTRLTWDLDMMGQGMCSSAVVTHVILYYKYVVWVTLVVMRVKKKATVSHLQSAKAVPNKMETVQQKKRYQLSPNHKDCCPATTLNNTLIMLQPTSFSTRLLSDITCDQHCKYTFLCPFSSKSPKCNAISHTVSLSEPVVCDMTQ